jgi:hypothetical protein
MSQQPPDWFRQPRGPRIGCADVTIVSIASIVAFVLLIFVVLRPGSTSFIDITGSNNITVGAVRATETPGSAPTTGPVGTTRAAGAVLSPGTTTARPTVTVIATPVPPTSISAPATPTVPPTPSFRTVKLLDSCRLRQDATYQAQIIQIFPKGSTFKVFDEQRKVIDPQSGTEVTWQRVEPDDKSNRQGWMVVECF